MNLNSNHPIKRKIGFYAGLFMLAFAGNNMPAEAKDQIRPVKKLMERVLNTSGKNCRFR